MATRIDENDLVRKMASLTRREKLEAEVRVRTPAYESLDLPQYDEELLKAHLELSESYRQDGNWGKAHEHFRSAEDEFTKMRQVQLGQSGYITESTDWREWKRNEGETERKLEQYGTQVIKLAARIGVDAEGLLLFPVTPDRKNNHLEDLFDTTFYLEPKKSSSP